MHEVISLQALTIIRPYFISKILEIAFITLLLIVFCLNWKVHAIGLVVNLSQFTMRINIASQLV